MAKKKNEPMPDYNRSLEEELWYMDGIRNGIRIAPKAANQGKCDEWFFDVFSKGRWHTSKFKYNREQVWEEFYKLYKFYYDKKHN